ncbi:hypothetical protein E0Z10_g8598 [Xylaria hypoxylon]|uniref:Ribosomal protein/NADH dehydrogenase domain-containing protein n=1 Tax=Xylaria hypoxylon TaxID=37992 RepID=A0A4Z0YL61_9PEZI|nr:hypothetical protein E0Z10_g8598 [Xylaria hypoxylon]
MSSKYTFTKALKEVRFLFCQGETSAATRCVRFLPSQGDVPDNALHNITDDKPRRNGVSGVIFLTTASHHLLRGNVTFLTRAYPIMKKNNPHTPILIREAAGTIPKIYTRYEFGKEKSQSLEGLSDKQIEETVATLVKSDV